MKTHAENHQAGFTLIEFIVGLVIAAIMAAMFYTYFGTALTQSSEPISRLQKASNLHQVMENIVADYNRLNELNLRYKWKASTVYPVNSVVVPTTNNGHYYKRVITSGTGTSGTAEPTTWTTTTGATVVDDGVTWTESGNVYFNSGLQYPNNTIVIPYYNNGHYYKCNSGTRAGEPVWPKNPGGTVLDGTVTWTEAGTILSSAEGSIENLSTLLPAVNDPITIGETNATRIRYGKGYTVTGKVFIRFNPGSSPPNQEDTTVTENNILKVTIKSNETNETLTQLFTIR